MPPQPLASPADMRPTNPFDDNGQVQQNHLAELQHLRRCQANPKGAAAKSRSSLSTSLFRYIQKNVQSYLIFLIVSPVAFITDPINSLATLIIFPTLFAALATVVLVFWLGSKLGGQKVIAKLGREYGGGLSFINWLNPSLFNEHSSEVIRDARSILAGEKTVIVEDDDSNAVPTILRIFSLPVSRALLLFSALVYERLDSFVSEASYSNKFPLKDGQLLSDSESVIKKIAKSWDVNFEGISDLSSPDGGPYCGVFWDEGPKPWIVVVFKGTSPSNFAEFLVDATISRMDGEIEYGSGAGTVHEGFYSDLFPTTSGGADGYGTIIQQLKHIGKRLQRESATPNEPVPIWVTGHSLGSALCVLLYTRLLHSPLDLGSSLILRDCYAYGTPRLGSGSWASSVSASLLTPLDRPNLLWRVINSSDVVCRVPPGLADNPDKRGMMSDGAILDYSHVGIAVELGSKNKSGVEIGDDQFLGKTRIEIREGEGHGRGKRKSSRWDVLREGDVNWVRWLITWLPGPVYNHYPAAYWANLNIIAGLKSRQDTSRKLVNHNTKK